MKTVALLVGLILAASAAPVCSREPVEVSGVIHIHSNFSSGQYSIPQLVEKARGLGIETLFITDHDRVAMEYGLWPLRNLLKIRKQLPSVLGEGVEQYLETIAEINRRQKEVLVIPGVQSTPFYYWTGNPLAGLTAHDCMKELLILGMSDPADYKGLPIPHNGFSLRYAASLLPLFLIFLAAFALSAALYIFGYKKIGLLAGAAALLLAIDHHPFRSSRFDPYHGKQGIAPYQEVIDYASARNGRVFWTHPESNFSVESREYGPIRMRTPHYPEALVESDNYSGFAAIYGDTVTATEPGAQWDRLLSDYCAGRRERPAWGIAEADFHSDHGGEPLDAYQTIFLVDRKTHEAVLDSLSKGKYYAVFKKGKARLRLDRFEIRGDSAGRSATMGETLIAPGGSEVVAGISATGGGSHPVTAILIKNGIPVRRMIGNTPMSFQFRSAPDASSPRRSFFRLMIDSPKLGRLISNPIFLSHP